MVDVSAHGNARNVDDELERLECKREAIMLNRPNSGGRIFNHLVLIVAFCLALQVPVQAHNGPPFPIVENKKVGPFVISLWTHPDLGTGTFFVIVDPAPGAMVPSDLKVQIAVQPESGRLPEAVYDTWRDAVRDHVQYDNNQVEFDKQEFWRVHLILRSSMGGGELFTRVEPTPTGLGKWDLLFYALPFLFAAFMWYRGISRRRKHMKKRAGSVSQTTRNLAPSGPERAAEQGNS